MTLFKEGKLKEALEIFKQAYQVRKKNLGDDHPDTMETKKRIVNIEKKPEEKTVPL